ncbi:MAG TPA: hypothetical protein VFY47_12120 [Thermoleophilaceae bacterium]|nr:hypothetical protein [Thermoleophilaceae bacterium]
MGILDDAIREHLELKRKHGVPEEEVERQEEEALGPARREVAQQPEDAEPAADEATSAPAAGGDAPTASPFDGDSAAPVTDEATPAEPTPAPEHAAAPEHAPEPVDAPVADHTGLEPPPVEDVPAAGAPAADEPELEPDPYEALGDTEPHGFPAVEEDEELEEDEALEENEELPASDADEEEDLDVLEDTPDFLQETPEHDRLWFEQKPPRDFDFD